MEKSLTRGTNDDCGKQLKAFSIALHVNNWPNELKLLCRCREVHMKGVYDGRLRMARSSSRMDLARVVLGVTEECSCVRESCEFCARIQSGQGGT